MKKQTLKEVRAAAKEAKESKRFNRDMKNGRTGIGITAKGFAMLYDAKGNEAAFNVKNAMEANQ